MQQNLNSFNNNGGISYMNNSDSGSSQSDFLMSHAYDYNWATAWENLF